MAEHRFYIGPPQTGEQSNVRPYLLPDDAYTYLRNAYTFRSRTRKRIGAGLLPTGHPDDQQKSRLRINLGTLAASPSSRNLPGGGSYLAVGQMFSVDTANLTVVELGLNKALLSTSGSITGTIDSTAVPNTVTITGAAGSDVYWYPALPVMGLLTLEKTTVNDESSIAFDTKFAYQRLGHAWERLGTGNPDFTGTDSDFFWGTNYRGAASYNYIFWVTNNVDAIHYWNGAAWTAFTPTTSGANTIQKAKIILPFQGRLLVFSPTIAGNVYRNQCRFSWIGDPTDAANGWLETDGKGGFINAPTQQAIVTAQFLKNRLIVYFERSTYELVYTNNQKLPFIWQKINTELGCESTFSQVPFDQVVLGIGNVGVHACNGSSVERIDNEIPDEVFSINNSSNGNDRVYGIRDYKLEMVYWTYPLFNENNKYPNKMMTYNYKNNAWSFNDDSLTCFGYWQTEDLLTWADITWPWSEWLSPWNSGANQAKERKIIAGNQQGWTFFLNDQIARNAPCLQITKIDTTTNQLTIIDHNLAEGDFLLIENISVNDPLVELNDKIFEITFIDKDTIQLQDSGVLAGSYKGAGTATRVSRIDIRTKEYSFYRKEGLLNAIEQVDFYVERTGYGELTIDYWGGSSDVSILSAADGTETAPIMGTSVLETFPYPDITLESSQARFWHPVYTSLQGETIQMRMYLTDTQMLDPNISLSDFQLNSMVITAQATQTFGG